MIKIEVGQLGYIFDNSPYFHPWYGSNFVLGPNRIIDMNIIAVPLCCGILLGYKNDYYGI